MKTLLSHRVMQIKPSPTLQLSAQANRLKAAGRPIINLTVGEPDFNTPDFIKQAAHHALDQNKTRYTAVDGLPGLKQAIVQKLSRENQLAYRPEQIIVSSGAKQSIYNLMQALLSPGDEVIIPAPYWVSYPDMALLAEARPVFIETHLAQQLKITAAQLAAAITPKTRLLILNSPSNPTGMVYTREELAALGEVLQQHPHVWVMSDDIYEHIYWGPSPFVNIINVCPTLYERTILINGCSKAYAMTGWRIGFAAGPADLIQAMANIQSQSTSNPNSIAQVAAQAAFEGDQQCVQEMNTLYEQRQRFFAQGLNDLPGVTCLPPMGAFYCFPTFSKWIGSSAPFTSDYVLADYLLNKANLATVPGSAFGAPGHLRLSFALDEATLKQALRQLNDALTELHK